ncbi:hypothetical protein AMJ51_00105 [Microgenomates bacterium DG_75]|nr:MAG: hypothetical protein AMJ51_00105 [Microgenomates bacterium DG_75]
MQPIIKYAILPTDILLKISGGNPLLAALVYPLTWLALIGLTCFMFFKKMSRQWLILIILLWIICLPYLIFNGLTVVFWLVMWVCNLFGGGSSCYL